MKKIWKRLAAIVAAACLALSCFMIVACGGGKADYTVSVTLPDGSAVSGLKVIFTNAEAKETVEQVTDEEGKFTVRLSTEKYYTLSVDEATLPADYSDFVLNKRRVLTSKKGGEISLQIVVPVIYSFTVKAPEGVEVDLSGMTVWYSETAEGEREELSGATDKNGELTVRMAGVNGYAFLGNLPEGYIYNENYSDTSYRLTATKPRGIVFELIPYAACPLQTAMTAEEIAKFQTETGNAKFTEEYPGGSRKAYSFREKIGVTPKHAYSFTAEETGEYWVFVNYAGESNYKLYSSSSKNFKYYDGYASNVSDPENGTNSFPHFAILCEKGKTYYLLLETDAEAEEDLEFVIVSPKIINRTLVTCVGDVTISIPDSLFAEISFTPNEAGSYTFETRPDLQVEVFSADNWQPVITSFEDGKFTIDVLRGNLQYDDGTRHDAVWIVRLTASSPADITIHITREDIVEYSMSVENISVKENLTKYADQTCTLKDVGVNNTISRIVKGDDGYYHLDSKTGAVVVIKLTGEIPVFYPESKFEEIDAESDSTFRFYIDTDEEKHVNNYANYSTFFHTYTNYVNEDGVYPLTEELRTFLELFAKDNSDWLAGCAGGIFTEDSLWLFSAFYYAE